MSKSISIESSNDNLILKLEKNIHKLKSIVDTFKLDRVPHPKDKNDVKILINSYNFLLVFC